MYGLLVVTLDRHNDASPYEVAFRNTQSYVRCATLMWVTRPGSSMSQFVQYYETQGNNTFCTALSRSFRNFSTGRLRITARSRDLSAADTVESNHQIVT